jgi:FKBP-type peptidyl-prolyl cis-trans isomerase FkpA
MKRSASGNNADNGSKSGSALLDPAYEKIRANLVASHTLNKERESMNRLIVTALITLLALPAVAADSPKTEEQKTLYAVGLIVARQLSVFNPSPAELEIIKQGISDARAGNKLEVDLAAYQDKVQALATTRRKAQGEKVAAANKVFLENAAREKNALKSDSGMIYTSLKDGAGAGPGPTDTVKVDYRGTLPDGKEFDSSYKRGKPFEFRMDGVIKCWSEGLQKMKAGGKARLVCPPEVAYGEAGAGELILPGATLLFEVELLEVKK